ncbi:LOB domain-containing protein 29-like [Pyrus ussuriensis x Pyrus communis]|uniref:LOB domain-containing protein 29-like n=1 Tax=Pyrus ussuriensis x Pyrus communis TaxID=2448454 RepID=A0A5N5H3B5_9ROSA|nr:LOB domain-containing protein 29-like [Pyrus ussuriensis x Pyrus communis]
MTGSGSPCGACKFLRRKCVRGCIFAPYFCQNKQCVEAACSPSGGDRCEAAMTISYEAQARLQDPIYGCVSHIFSLQQQKFYGKAPSHQKFINGMMNSNNSVNGSHENSVNIPDENVSSYGSFEEGTSHSMSSFDVQTNYNKQWGFHDANELQSVAFSYIDQHS